jgi:cell division protein FtsB
VLVLAGLGFLVFNDSGFIKYLKHKSEVDELNKEVIAKELENKDREAEIDSLEKKNPAKIEKIAREKYGMMKKGEKVIKVEEK